MPGIQIPAVYGLWAIRQFVLKLNAITIDVYDITFLTRIHKSRTKTEVFLNVQACDRLTVSGLHTLSHTCCTRGVWICWKLMARKFLLQKVTIKLQKSSEYQASPNFKRSHRVPNYIWINQNAQANVVSEN